RAPHFPLNVFEVLNGVLGRHDRISPALINYQLAARLLETGKIRIHSRNEPKRAVRVLDITVEIERRWTPVRIVKHPISPEVDPSRLRSIHEVSGPAPSAIRERLTAANPSRENVFTCARVLCPGVNFANCLNLRLRQAGWRISVLA